MSARKIDHNRVYKMGFSAARPLHFPDENGSPAGLAVGMVREAARRRGIRLSWVQSATPGIEAMKKGEADFWVVMTDLPERRKQVHITEPFLVTEYCFLVLADSSVRRAADLANARVMSPGFGIHRILLASLLPKARLESATPQEAFSALNAGTVDAVFLEQYTAGDLALAGSVGKKLRMVGAPVPRGYLGLAANFDVAPVADEIRDEIRAMASDGTMAPIFEGWSFFPGLNLEAIEALSTARRRERLLMSGLAILVILLGCTFALVLRLRRQRTCLENVRSALRQSAEYHRTLIELLPDTIYVVEPDARSRTEAPAARKVRRTDPDLDWLVASPPHRRNVDAVAATGAMKAAEVISPEGRSLEYRLVPLRQADGRITGAMGILRDRTDHRRAEQEKARLEEQLRHAQKMESVGRLAGGVAHDFNNLLTVINGYTSLMLAEFPADSPESGRLTQVLQAGKRAGALTSQLLAFSRKQLIQPKPADLNQIVEDAGAMLGRLLGADIQLKIGLTRGLAPVVVDSGQIDQVLMNFAANARDAMPEGGCFTVETSQTVWTDDDVHDNPEGVPGDCVLLSVSDSGLGMDKATASRIFEPFFTTKPEGRGTGLGLSTVYGIVRQSGGWISVASEPGVGTTFRVYLPVLRDDTPGTRPEGRETDDYRRPVPAAGYRETILLVEDENDIRALEAEVLRSLGYRVIEAPGPTEALIENDRFAGEIDMLLTDVVLPGMRGPELARRIRGRRPEIKLLFASGYAGELDPKRDRLILESTLLPKPFTADALIEAVRRCFDQVRRSFDGDAGAKRQA